MLCRNLLLIFLLTASLCFAQGKPPFTFEDMMSLKRLSDPQISPDGKWVLFSAVDVDLGKNTRVSHLWIVPAAGGESRQITRDPAGENRGRWSPDGKRFLFTSSKDGESQIWVADFDRVKGETSGAPLRVTSISTEADGALWAPDGKHILFISSVYPGCIDDACNRARIEEKKKSPVKAMVFTRLFFRHWNQYVDDMRSHIFVEPVDPDGRPAGPARDLTPGEYDAPVFSLGGGDLYAFSPDGQEVCFTSNHDPNPAVSTNNDLWIVPVNGGPAKNITAANPASDSTPLYSPDGKYIAYLAQARPGYESDRFRLMLYDRASGKVFSLTEKFDRWVGSFTWTPDSNTIYFAAEDAGESPIYSADISADKANPSLPVTALMKKGSSQSNSRKGPPVLIRGSNDELSVTPDGKAIIFSRNSVRAPNEVFSLSTRMNCGGEVVVKDKSGRMRSEALCTYPPAQAITRMNDSVLSRVQTQPLESFRFDGAEKKQVQGFIVMPPDFDSGRKYPVKFLVHGGPQQAWGDAWSYRWNPQLFAASGYVVVMINPRGSTGYGQQFIDDINGDWGGRVFKDLMLGLDFAEKTYPFIDKNRECALGASYGGYMMNWILGHTTRFKCLVSHDGMFNAESAWGSTEELWFNEWEFKGTPWSNRAMYQKWSPHMYAANFKTPTLVVHGQLDYRLDVSEGFQLFTTLQRLGVPSKMLFFPDEGHWVQKPQNGRLWNKTVSEWIDQWTK